MMDLKWTDVGWDDYVSWENNRSKLKRINKLIKDMKRHPFSGLGKPESLKNDLSGLWSRRIDVKNRIVYACENGQLIIFSCKDHY